MTSLTRGPLPARVYWTRRLLVLGLALLLVLAIGHLLGGGSDGSDSSTQDRAVQAAADPTAAATTGTTDAATPGPGVPADTEATDPSATATTAAAPVLAEPDGTCADEDVAVTPSIRDAVAGADDGIAIVLLLRTATSPACTWHVSAHSLTVKITSGDDDVWSSRQCPRAIEKQDVVVRNAVTTRVVVTWNGRRSDDSCSRFTDWAMPGWYHVTAAALAGEPSDLQFRLEAPVAPTITRSPEPTQDPVDSRAGKKGGRPVAPQSGATAD
jgi:hypothetical protein